MNIILRCKRCNGFSVEFNNLGPEQEQKRKAAMAGKRIQDHVALTHPKEWARFLRKNLGLLKKDPRDYSDAFYENFVEEI